MNNTLTPEERKALIESIINDISDLKGKQEIIPACVPVSILDKT